MIYLSILIILIFFALYYDVLQHSNGRKLSIYFLTILLIALAGLRYRVGLDTLQYMLFYDNIPRFSDISVAHFVLSRHEPFYFLIEVLAKTISPHFFVLQLIQSLFVNVVIIYFFKKHTQYVFTCILLYYLILYITFNTEAMRSSMAVAVFLLSYDFFIEKKWVRYYVFCIIAIMFHTSAIILVVLPFFSKIKLIRVSFIIYAIPVFLLTYTIGNNVELFFNMVSFTDNLSSKASGYVNSTYGGQVLSFSGVISNMLMYVLIPFSVVRRLLKINKRRLDYEYFILLVIVISIISIRVQIIYRLLDYFIPFMILGFAEYLGALTYKRKFSSSTRLYSVVLISLFLVLKIYGQYFGDISGIYNYKRYLPYSSIITSELFEEREKLFSKGYRGRN